MTRLIPILDGHIAFDPSLLPEVRKAPGEAVRLLGATSMPDAIDVPVWCYLVTSPLGLGLIDTGSGALFGEPDGRLRDSFARHGVRPEDIGRIWLTHLHGDHCGGLIAMDGEPAFPTARIALPEAEAAFWLDGQHTDMAADIARDARAALAPYQGRIDLVGDEAEIDGAIALAAPGHTPGHMAWHLPEHGALAAGDIFHLPALQLPNPDWSSDWDSDPDLASATRTSLITRARRRSLTLLTGHGGMIEPQSLPAQDETETEHS